MHARQELLMSGHTADDSSSKGSGKSSSGAIEWLRQGVTNVAVENHIGVDVIKYSVSVG